MRRAPLGYGGLRFADAGCNEQFASAGEIGTDRLDAFARCLEALSFTGSARESQFLSTWSRSRTSPASRSRCASTPMTRP